MDCRGFLRFDGLSLIAVLVTALVECVVQQSTRKEESLAEVDWLMTLLLGPFIQTAARRGSHPKPGHP